MLSPSHMLEVGNTSLPVMQEIGAICNTTLGMDRVICHCTLFCGWLFQALENRSTATRSFTDRLRTQMTINRDIFFKEPSKMGKINIIISLTEVVYSELIEGDVTQQSSNTTPESKYHT